MRALAVVCGLGVVAVPTAQAGGPNIPHVQSVLKIRNAFPAFHGRVVADDDFDYCNGSRPVKMYERKRSGGRRLIDKTTTDLDGKWEVIVEPLTSGSYFAAAPEVRGFNDQIGEFVCFRAKSRELFID